MPPFIKKLDFKSKEELQKMPQTEEEHLENQCLDYDDNGKHNPDAEVSPLISLPSPLTPFEPTRVSISTHSIFRSLIMNLNLFSLPF